MTRFALYLLLVTGCAVEADVEADESALATETRAKCANDCAKRYSARCDTLNDAAEWYTCLDSCRVEAPASDACESSYVAYIDCARLAPHPAYVCHSPGPGQPTEPYPRDPDLCDAQAVAWWWCELTH